MGFAGNLEVFAAHHFETETQIEVVVGRILAARRNLMDIEIEDGISQRYDTQSRFLFGFTLCDGKRVRIAITVAAELQPAIEFTVVCEQYMAAWCIHHPGRTRYMPGPAVAFKTAHLGVNETTKPFDGLPLLPVPELIVVDQLARTLPVHSNASILRTQ